MPDLIIKNLTKHFNELVAVDHIDLHVNDGELVTLLGPSGCGKTTTLRLIAGLERPDEGDIFLGDEIVSCSGTGQHKPPEKRGMGMVFQSYAVWPHMTVGENVAYPLKVRRKPKAEIKEKVKKSLDLVGLAGLEDRPATLLSGGQQQRVAMARALVFEPRILLLDEPLSNLDFKLRESMRIELKLLQKRTGITAVYVTHDQTEAMVLSDRICLMDHGKIVQIGTPIEIYETPSTKFVVDFIGRTNFIKGKIEEISGDTCLISATRAQNMRILSNAPQGKPRVGDDVTVSIRSESIVLNPECAEIKPNMWNGKITTASYLGDHWDFIVSIGEEVLWVSLPKSYRYRTNDKVCAVVVEPEGIQCWLS